MKTPTGLPPLRVLVLAIVCLLAVVPLPAGGGGSVYSRYGVGDLRITASTPIWGLGATGAAYQPSGSINDVNPAAWSSIPRIRFSTGAIYEGFKTTDGTSSAYLTGVYFNGLCFAIPVDSGLGITVGGGVVPYSRVNYTVVEPVEQAGLSYELTHIGEGGTSRFFTGASIRVLPGLSAAAQFNYYFGSTRYSMNQHFTGSGYTDADFTRRESVRGFGSTFGVLYDPGDPVAFGLSLTTTAWPTVETERIYQYGAAVSSTTADTVNGGERSVRLPYSLTGGMTYRSGNVLAAADVRFQEWSGNTYETYPSVRLKNTVRISAGAELTRAGVGNESPGRRVTYSLGIYHDAGYLEIGGEAISENGVTAGISFPILNETRFSLAAGFAMRGSTDDILQEDKIFRISASMDISEFWFQRPVEE